MRIIFGNLISLFSPLWLTDIYIFLMANEIDSAQSPLVVAYVWWYISTCIFGPLRTFISSKALWSTAYKRKSMRKWEQKKIAQSTCYSFNSMLIQSILKCSWQIKFLWTEYTRDIFFAMLTLFHRNGLLQKLKSFKFTPAVANKFRSIAWLYTYRIVKWEYVL